MAKEVGPWRGPGAGVGLVFSRDTAPDECDSTAEEGVGSGREQGPVARSLSPEKGHRDPPRNVVARMASGEFVGERLVRKAEQRGAGHE